MSNLKTELRRLRIKAGLIKINEFSAKENKEFSEMLKNGKPLPEGVFQTKLENGTPIDEFYTACESNLSPEEEKQYIMLKNHRCLVTIEACTVIVAAIAGIYFAFSLLMIL